MKHTSLRNLSTGCISTWSCLLWLVSTQNLSLECISTRMMLTSFASGRSTEVRYFRMNPCKEWMEEFEADEMIPRGYRFLSHNGMRIFKISVESYQSFRVYIQNIEADNEISVPITE